VEIYRFYEDTIAELWTSNMWLETYRQLGWYLVVEIGVPTFERGAA